MLLRSIRRQQMRVLARQRGGLFGLHQIAVADRQPIQMRAHEAAEGVFR